MSVLNTVKDPVIGKEGRKKGREEGGKEMKRDKLMI